MIPGDELLERCRADGELRLAARHWTGGARLRFDDGELVVGLDNGEITDQLPADNRGVITLTASADVWDRMLAPTPEPFLNDVVPAQNQGLTRAGDELTYWQYLPALQRIIELWRGSDPGDHPVAARRNEAQIFDAPAGRYVHLDLAGDDHRVYFEEAGAGIPLLLQHTAGSHGVQWRHLFEEPAITEHFRLIAYDLPFHGKSVPPTGRKWWAERYRLTGEFVRSVPVALADALGLDRPVFMGCSVGGLLALDLAAHHPDRFRAVISVEGALRVGGDPENLLGFWHPGVSNESKARMMEGLTSPSSPVAYRKETTQTYAAGWPPAFVGDLHYYSVDYDLRDRAGEIDTEQVGVHILTGEYDYSATPEHGRTAHEAITGSTFSVMDGVGHFPMSENPDAFLEYLLPVLDQIRNGPNPT